LFSIPGFTTFCKNLQEIHEIILFLAISSFHLTATKLANVYVRVILKISYHNFKHVRVISRERKKPSLPSVFVNLSV